MTSEDDLNLAELCLGKELWILEVLEGMWFVKKDLYHVVQSLELKSFHLLQTMYIWSLPVFRVSILLSPTVLMFKMLHLDGLFMYSVGSY